MLGFTAAMHSDRSGGETCRCRFDRARHGNAMERLSGPWRPHEHSGTGGTGDPECGITLGILSPPLFTMMVLMALITTFMTTPILIAMKVDSTSS